MAQHPVLTLKRIHDMTLVCAAALGIVYVAIILGIMSDQICLPAGLAGIIAGMALLFYASRNHDRSWEASDDVGNWARSIRRMALVNIALAVLLLAIPDVA